ncbi:hypothetical protein AB0N05_13085 [Nocardia sp. NPDC051030]|uniref:hypothetical protein n=1 Tax=Nocardia sp. NPDC051030 TaxID=3155162 RepID=UPI003414F0B0
MMAGPDLPKPDKPFTLDDWLHRWPASVYATELHDGVLVFIGRDSFTPRDVEAAQRTYPGRRILLDDTGKLEIHPAGDGPPTSIYHHTDSLRNTLSPTHA